MPALLLALLIIGTAVAVALAGLRLFRPRKAEEPTHEVAGFLIAVVAAVYAVVLGFVTVKVWGDFGEASVIVSSEATEATAAYETACALPEPDQSRLRTLIAAYVREARDEWPDLARGRGSLRARAALRQVLLASAQVKPSNLREQVLYGNLIHSLHEMRKARDLRLLAAGDTVHPAVWFVLVGGGLITIGFTWFFRLGRFRTQAVMTAGVAALIALNLFLIAVTDRPFTGDVRVQPEAFQETMRDIETMPRAPAPGAR